MKAPRQLSSLRYNDLYFRIIASIVGGHFIVMFGEQINFFQALLMPRYYIALAGSVVIAFLLITTVWLITNWLDKYYDWYEHIYLRSVFQLLMGVAMTSLLAFLLAALYFDVRGVNILDTLYLRFDYPLIVVLIAAVNVYYIAQYFARLLLAQRQAGMTGSPQVENLEITGQVVKEMLVVKGVDDTKLVPLKDIAICYVNESGLHLATFDNRALFCPYLKIADAIKKLDKKDFFQVNPKMIVALAAIESYTVLDNNTLGLTLNFPFDYPVVVSQSRTPAFREWIGQ